MISQTFSKTHTTCVILMAVHFDNNKGFKLTHSSTHNPNKQSKHFISTLCLFTPQINRKLALVLIKKVMKTPAKSVFYVSDCQRFGNESEGL